MRDERIQRTQEAGGVLHSDAADPTIIHGMKVTSIAIVAVIPLLTSCASSGLYYMSDDWCAAHLSASAARCPKDQERVVHKDQERVVHNDSERVADNETRQSN
jgi:hypothetical protein